VNDSSPFEQFRIALAFTGALRQKLISGKLSEAGLKLFADRSVVCPHDGLADNLKLLEELINASPDKEKLGVGLALLADSLYLPEQRKYELENPK